MIVLFLKERFFVYWNQVLNSIDSGWFINLCERSTSTLPCGNTWDQPLWIFPFPPYAMKLCFFSNNTIPGRGRDIFKNNRTIQKTITSSKKFPTDWRFTATSNHQPCDDSTVLLPKTTWNNLFLHTQCLQALPGYPNGGGGPVEALVTLVLIPHHGEPSTGTSWGCIIMHGLCEPDHSVISAGS